MKSFLLLFLVATPEQDVWRRLKYDPEGVLGKVYPIEAPKRRLQFFNEKLWYDKGIACWTESLHVQGEKESGFQGVKNRAWGAFQFNHSTRTFEVISTPEELCFPRPAISRAMFPKVTKLSVIDEPMAERRQFWVSVELDLLLVGTYSLQAFELSTGKERWKIPAGFDVEFLLGLQQAKELRLLVQEWGTEDVWAFDVKTGKARRTKLPKRMVRKAFQGENVVCDQQMFDQYKTSVFSRWVLDATRWNSTKTCYLGTRSVEVSADFREALRDSDALCSPAIARGNRFEVALCHGEILRFGGGLPIERSGKAVAKSSVMLNPFGVLFENVEGGIGYFDPAGNTLLHLPELKNVDAKDWYQLPFMTRPVGERLLVFWTHGTWRRPPPWEQNHYTVVLYEPSGKPVWEKRFQLPGAGDYLRYEPPREELSSPVF